MEPLLGYHPCSIGFLTSSRDPAGGQCQVGSLTGAVTTEDMFKLVEDEQDSLTAVSLPSAFALF